uniref:SERPIN domain-containing protein n=1 Tax=Syphacia muris TaxID=451379 RepID=A0A0N5ALK6_9BILA
MRLSFLYKKAIKICQNTIPVLVNAQHLQLIAELISDYTEYVFKDYILNYVNNLLISSNGDDFELYAINGVYPIVESLSCLDDEANPTDETLPTTVFPLPSTYEDFDSVINYWIMLNTNGTIDDAVPPETLSDLSSPIVSAIYFKGNWKVGFPASATSKEKFNGLTKEVEMMKGSGNFEYYGDKKLQVVVLPYKGENLKMVLMVPDVDVKFEDWLRSLNTKLIERYIGKVKLTHLKLEMPKILLEYSVDLRSSLDSMRLYNVFHYNSVIKGGCTKGKKIDYVFHTAYIEVDESGGKQKPFKASNAKKTAPKKFVVDRPFIFLILRTVYVQCQKLEVLAQKMLSVA